MQEGYNRRLATLEKRINKAMKEESLDPLKVLLQDQFIRKINLTPFIIEALLTGDENKLDIFLATKCDLNKVNSFTTPLMEAVKHSNHRVIEKLIKHGAAVNTTIIGETALSIAVEHNDVRKAKTLIKHGAFVDRLTGMPSMPLLHHAIAHANVKMVQCLLEGGANPDDTEIHDVNTVMQAIDKKNLNILKTIMLYGGNVHTTDRLDFTPLHRVARMKHPEDVEAAKILIKKGAELNSLSAFEMTPLGEAIIRKKAALSSLLLHEGASLNIPCETHTLPLQLAIKRGSSKIVKILIKAGADINTPNHRGVTPLYCALLYRKPKSVRLLLDAGANIYGNFRPDFKDTYREIDTSLFKQLAIKIVKQRTNKEQEEKEIASIEKLEPMCGLMLKTAFQQSREMMKTLYYNGVTYHELLCQPTYLILQKIMHQDYRINHLPRPNKFSIFEEELETKRSEIINAFREWRKMKIINEENNLKLPMEMIFEITKHSISV